MRKAIAAQAIYSEKATLSIENTLAQIWGAQPKFEPYGEGSWALGPIESSRFSFEQLGLKKTTRVKRSYTVGHLWWKKEIHEEAQVWVSILDNGKEDVWPMIWEEERKNLSILYPFYACIEQNKCEGGGHGLYIKSIRVQISGYEGLGLKGVEKFSNQVLLEKKGIEAGQKLLDLARIDIPCADKVLILLPEEENFLKDLVLDAMREGNISSGESINTDEVYEHGFAPQ